MIGQELNCPICGNKFKQKHRKHAFCSRKCFLKFNRKKITEYPVFHCFQCQTVTPLDFFPKSNPKKWLDFECPGCMPGVEIKITINSQVTVLRTS